jgi:alkylation response protein AidB-like acyl-CoA dehydrogenase
MDTFGGYGYAWEIGIERKLREIRLYKVAPVNQNLVLAYIGHNILGLPRSYEP